MGRPAERFTVHDPDTGAEIEGTLEELARRFGANPNTVRTTMYSRGIGLEQALMAARRGREKLSVEVGGKIHQGTFRELCRKFGTPPSAVRGRMKSRGMSLGEALAAPKRGVPRHRIIDPATGEPVEGTLKELAMRFRISKNTVNDRMAQGMTLQEALTTPKWGAETREAVDPATGEIVMGTARELAERFGTDLGTVKWRMSRDGMSFQDAVTTPKRSFVEHEVLDPDTGEAVTGTIRELSERFGMNEHTVRARLRRGMTLQEALTEPKRLFRRYEVRDPETGEAVAGTIPELSDRFGMEEGMVRNRLQRGMTLQEALTRPRMRGVEYEVVDPKTGEIVKSTIKALSRRFGMNESTVRNRLRHGMDIQEALTKPVRGSGR